MQLVQELCEQDISNFFAQASTGGSLEDRLQAVTEFMLQNAQYYLQQLLLWVEFFQQTRQGSEEEARFLRQVWDRTRDTLQDYLQIKDSVLVDFVMVFIDGLIMQFIYDREVGEAGAEEMAWFEQQCQLMIQMVVRHEQSVRKTQT